MIQVTQNPDDWKRGFGAGRSGEPGTPPPGVDRLSWLSGYVEGKAELARYTPSNALADPSQRDGHRCRGSVKKNRGGSRRQAGNRYSS